MNLDEDDDECTCVKCECHPPSRAEITRRTVSKEPAEPPRPSPPQLQTIPRLSTAKPLRRCLCSLASFQLPLSKVELEASSVKPNSVALHTAPETHRASTAPHTISQRPPPPINEEEPSPAVSAEDKCTGPGLSSISKKHTLTSVTLLVHSTPSTSSLLSSSTLPPAPSPEEPPKCTAPCAIPKVCEAKEASAFFDTRSDQSLQLGRISTDSTPANSIPAMSKATVSEFLIKESEPDWKTEDWDRFGLFIAAECKSMSKKQARKFKIKCLELILEASQN